MFEFMTDVRCIFCLMLPFVCGSSDETYCQNSVDTFIVNATLGSKVVLPCNFKSTSLKKSLDQGWVLWTQRNSSSLVNISSEGWIDFLNPRDGRVKIFPNQFDDGSYSMRIDKLQDSDLGFYSCESLKDGCYHVVVMEEKHVWSLGLKTLVYVAAVIGLILFLTCSYGCVKCAWICERENVYENSDFKHEARASAPSQEIAAEEVGPGAMEERGSNVNRRTIYDNSEHDPDQHDQNRSQHDIITHLHGFAISQPGQPRFQSHPTANQHIATPNQHIPSTNQHIATTNQHVSERTASPKRNQGFHRELLSRFRQASFGRYYVNQAEISQQATSSRTENPQRASFWRKKSNPKREYVNPIYN